MGTMVLTDTLQCVLGLPGQEIEGSAREESSDSVIGEALLTRRLDRNLLERPEHGPGIAIPSLYGLSWADAGERLLKAVSPHFCQLHFPLARMSVRGYLYFVYVKSKEAETGTWRLPIHKPTCAVAIEWASLA